MNCNNWVPQRVHHYRGLLNNGIPDINQQVNVLNNFLTSLLDNMAPVVTYASRRPPAPWITKEICSLMRAPDSYHRLYTRTPSRLSEWLEVTCGVGPLLFTLYIKDINSEIRNCKIVKYADNLQIYLHAPLTELGSAITLVNDNVRRIVTRSSQNFLKLNPTKT